MTLIGYKDMMPKVHESVFVAMGSYIVGDVEIGEHSSVWYNAVIRGDVAPVRIGSYVNVQEGCVIHETTGGNGVHIGNRVTIGHKALIHDCTLEDDTFIGMGSIILDGARVESYGMLAAGALLTYGKVIPSGELWSGSPAKFMRKVREEERRMFDWSYHHYSKLGSEHKASNEALEG